MTVLYCMFTPKDTLCGYPVHVHSYIHTRCTTYTFVCKYKIENIFS